MELISTIEKMKAILAERGKEPLVDRPRKQLSDLLKETQDDIFNRLGTKWRLAITNKLSRKLAGRSFEKIENITLFRPG